VTDFCKEVVGMAVAEISVVPVGTGSPSISGDVAAAVGLLRSEKRLKYELTPMGTIVEGDVKDILRVAGRMHQAVLDGGAQRVLTNIKIDDRRDKSLTMRGKVKSVERKLEA
jgi:uncharacterized protein (TIGR00106 family)